MMNKLKRKSITFLLVLSILISQSFGGIVAFASDDPINHTEKSNTTYYNYRDIYAASSIGYMGAEWSNSRNCWEFNYRFAGTGASRISGSDSDDIRIAAMQIEGVDNTDNMALWSSADEKYIGSAPESKGDTPDYSFANAVIGFAITAINNLEAGYAWAVYGLIDALHSDVDNEVNEADYLWRAWDWDSDISDTGQFFWFMVDVEPNETVKMSYSYMIFGPGYELLEAGEGTRELIAAGPSSKSITTTLEDWNPGMMTDEEKEKYGIEEITLNNIEKRAQELNISSERVSEFINSDEEVLYYAHNLTEGEIDVIQNSNNMTKDSLIKDIEDQLDRSNKIIKAYSPIEDNSEENQLIIEKHKSMQQKLENLLDEVKMSDDDIDVDALYNEYGEMF
ncbi:hypothetical protein [Wukongibacter sp. M2B1]|uniref:hypothetical protein n=1 Tax=Wukongibacter sp. M2B1 TaxID=3088895 RepID=UPI003D7B0E7C